MCYLFLSYKSFFFKDFIYLFMRDREREGEKQAPCRETNAGLDPWAKGRHFNLWATQVPLSHIHSFKTTTTTNFGYLSLNFRKVSNYELIIKYILSVLIFLFLLSGHLHWALSKQSDTFALCTNVRNMRTCLCQAAQRVWAEADPSSFLKHLGFPVSSEQNPCHSAESGAVLGSWQAVSRGVCWTEARRPSMMWWNQQSRVSANEAPWTMSRNSEVSRQAEVVILLWWHFTPPFQNYAASPLSHLTIHFATETKSQTPQPLKGQLKASVAMRNNW